jgi:hypothetical protein
MIYIYYIPDLDILVEAAFADHEACLWCGELYETIMLGPL